MIGFHFLFELLALFAFLSLLIKLENKLHSMFLGVSGPVQCTTCMCLCVKDIFVMDIR
jgi:hypothetical protein